MLNSCGGRSGPNCIIRRRALVRSNEPYRIQIIELGIGQYATAFMIRKYNSAISFLIDARHRPQTCLIHIHKANAFWYDAFAHWLVSANSRRAPSHPEIHSKFWPQR
jgi:hypothetical protein